jgi:parallel beta-helix repeat protein
MTDCREELEENDLMDLLRTYRLAFQRLAITGALFAVVAGSACASSVTIKNTTNGLAKAIDQAGPGGTVFVQGTCREEHSVTIPYPVTIRGTRAGGDPQPTLIILPDNFLNAMVILGDSVWVQSLHIVPWNANVGNVSTLFYVSGQTFRTQQCQIDGWRIGLYLAGNASQVWVSRNTFIASSMNKSQNAALAGAGLFSQFAAETVFLADNTFSGYNVAAFIDSSSGHRISGNTAADCNVGFWVSGAVQSIITGNIVSGTAQAGILLDGGASGVAIYSNRVTGSAGDSIRAGADTSGNRIFSNRVDKPVNDLGKNNVHDNGA